MPGCIIRHAPTTGDVNLWRRGGVGAVDAEEVEEKENKKDAAENFYTTRCRVGRGIERAVLLL